MVKRIGWAAVVIATTTDAGVGAPAPEIAAITWLYSPPKAVADLRGRVALVELWTFRCYKLPRRRAAREGVETASTRSAA